jgi:hypothetical protein
MGFREKCLKVYVAVRAEFTASGGLLPLCIKWEDGEEYRVDKVLDIRPAHALKAGGQGNRYTIMVRGRPSFLFFEHNPELDPLNLGRWFVERR